MIDFFVSLESIDDPRQPWKVKHSIKDILAICLLATIANANEWTEIYAFAEMNEEFLRKYLELANGIPSHDTIQRVMGIIDPKVLQALYLKWNALMNENEGEKIKKLLNIDGKTMRDSGNCNKNPLHVVSAWCKEDGVCLGQTKVGVKENEIIAIPELIDSINMKGYIVTIDAMGTQTDIVKRIVKKKADYVLAVKGNQGILHVDIIDYFEDKSLKSACEKFETIEKAHGQIEKRVYYQTGDIGWLDPKNKWVKLKTIGMVEKTIEKDVKVTIEKRYYIISLDVDVPEFARCVRGHWAIESLHWHLDVTFREDFNKTLDENGALNLNILRKIALSILKTTDIGRKCSQKLKRFYICSNPTKFLGQILNS
jgi:predicted transposase YbfD/YdcC